MSVVLLDGFLTLFTTVGSYVLQELTDIDAVLGKIEADVMVVAKFV